MSMQSLEREILAHAKIVAKNPNLKMKDLLAWSSGGVKAREGEIVMSIPNYGVNICILKVNDKRKPV